MIKVRSVFNFNSLRYVSISYSMKKDNDDKKSKSLNKLNNLLSDLSKKSVEKKTYQKLDLAKPKQLHLKKTKSEERSKKDEDPKDLAGKLEVAAKQVADVYGGNKRETESELLNLLLAYQKDPTGQSPSSSKPALSDLITGMKVERKAKEQPERDRYVSSESREGRAGEVRKALANKKPLRQPRQSDQEPKKVNLWGDSEGLDIFDLKKDFVEGPRLQTWSTLYAKDLKLSITHPPSNIFEQMILWTEQGKLWHFPIDNEQGLDDENNVDFTQHVMLDQYLEPWCAKKGPIANFMELVLVGLSKNPYYTVQEKIEHIYWFRDYFAYKNNIITSLGLPEIPQENPNFNLDVEVDFIKWGHEINRVRKY